MMTFTVQRFPASTSNDHIPNERARRSRPLSTSPHTRVPDVPGSQPNLQNADRRLLYVPRHNFPWQTLTLARLFEGADCSFIHALILTASDHDATVLRKAFQGLLEFESFLRVKPEVTFPCYVVKTKVDG